ncbi:hypothetical protein J7T55_007937 [Diaporthe amygdali]|uniref:uncharacterized protein n=1 Tax=Phomopsis amygdali TaxID=1214568 RepID=UPI0022FECD11|nr:uncharacterized protein J7T55_007937 [Diaporthe amygdali]KAJ0114103.1 hypothetical protein J7T55_007937 [Diaporthe amygdali]
MSPQFEKLPVIIHDRILCSLPAPNDVANTIRASPGCLHANSDCNSDPCSVLVNINFKDEFHNFLDDINLRPLTLDTFDWSLKLYADIAKAITDYTSFTFARSQHRTLKLSTPEASRARCTSFKLPRVNDEETKRLWRGFLLYELCCRIDGVPMITATDESHWEASMKSRLSAALTRLPVFMQEEVLCIQEYVRAQYDLAFNGIVESFELAVNEIGRQALDKSTTLIGSTKTIQQFLETEDCADDIYHLVEPRYSQANDWSINIAMLGVIFLRHFLSWDSSARLDFIRNTYWSLGKDYDGLEDFETAGHVPAVYIDMNEMAMIRFGWPRHTSYFLLQYNRLCPSESRLRSVGWIFWIKPERLHLMNLWDLNQGLLEENYGLHGNIRPHLRLRGRSHLKETLVQRQDLEHIVRQFGADVLSNHRLNKFKDFLRAICDPSSSGNADIAPLLLSQDDEDDAAPEDKAGGK